MPSISAMRWRTLPSWVGCKCSDVVPSINTFERKKCENGGRHAFIDVALYFHSTFVRRSVNNEVINDRVRHSRGGAFAVARCPEAPGVGQKIRSTEPLVERAIDGDR